MPKSVQKFHTSGLSIELEQRPSKSLKKYGEGRLKITIGKTLIWYTEKEDGTFKGIGWTWKDLLSFLTSNWVWLLNEQGLPFPVKYSPDVLAGTPAELGDELAKKNGAELTKEEWRALRTFCQRHDLAYAGPGISLPSLFLLRTGNQFLFSAKPKQILIDMEEALRILSEIGDTVHAWMLPFEDRTTKPLLDAWMARNRKVSETVGSKLHLLARMTKTDFSVLQTDTGQPWGNTWDGPIMHESEMFAAARMSSGFVTLAEQMDILTAIRQAPAVASAEAKLDHLGSCLREAVPSLSEFDEHNTAHEQGYALSESLHLCLQMRDTTIPLDPEKLLDSLGVIIQKREWVDSPLDALSCWSANHGPLIILNVADGKRCSHIYGRRFTLAHELCHLLVDRGLALGLVDVLGGGMPSFIERRANAFAAEFLLPRQLAAREFRNSEEENNVFLERLRTTYMVSAKTAASQIYNSAALYWADEESKQFFYAQVHEHEDGANDDI